MEKYLKGKEKFEKNSKIKIRKILSLTIENYLNCKKNFFIREHIIFIDEKKEKI